VNIKAVGINARYTHSCLSLFYLRNELEKNSPETTVEICQYTINDPHYVLIQRLCEGNPDYFFFSSAIWNSELTIALISDLLLINETYRFVIGGPQAEIVGESLGTSERITIYKGSIEGADNSFFSDLAKGRLDQFYSTSFFKTGKTDYDYPYRPEDFSGPLKNRHVYYESSRGCPFSCTYCLSSAEKGLYHKPLDRVVEELADILKYKPSVVRFIDRTFNDVPDRALQIWNYLKDHGGHTLFHFEIAPDRFTDKMFDFLEGMDAKRFQFEIGIQSTHQQTLEAIKRPINPQSAAMVVQRLRKMETIHLHADLILGLPFETKEMFFRSVNDIFAMEPHYIQMGLLKLLPGTLIDEEAVQNGYRASKRPPYSVYSNNWLNADSLRELYWLSECVEKYVNNRYFVTIWRYLLKSGENMSLFFSSLSRRLHQHGYYWKAATQETLSRLLLRHVESRPDFTLLKELLCYDWLRCGHRFLPDHLQDADLEPNELRKTLFRQLPESLTGCYENSDRAYFFKKSIFYLFSRESLHHIGYEVKSVQGIVRFLSERENNVLGLHRAQLIAQQQ
jgi:radical SAM superfamily enzyme YgiQ (UPF0313 family)